MENLLEKFVTQDVVHVSFWFCVAVLGCVVLCCVVSLCQRFHMGLVFDGRDGWMRGRREKGD